jgi:hypothetical protein
MNVLKVSPQTGQSGAANKTSLKSTALDADFHEVKTCKRYFSNDTSWTAKKSAKSVPTTIAIKLPPKPMLTHNFFAPLRTTDMDTETTGAENTLPEQEVP